jgi:hypothetical protein
MRCPPQERYWNPVGQEMRFIPSFSFEHRRGKTTSEDKEALLRIRRPY